MLPTFKYALAWDALLTAAIAAAAWYLLTHWAFVPPLGRLMFWPTLLVGAWGLAGEWRTNYLVLSVEWRYRAGQRFRPR